jgi:ankyrin repeat protein
MVDVAGPNGWTALFFASEANAAKKVQFLLDYGANVYAKDIYNRVPIQVVGGHEAARVFIDYDEDGYTAQFLKDLIIPQPRLRLMRLLGSTTTTVPP